MKQDVSVMSYHREAEFYHVLPQSSHVPYVFYVHLPGLERLVGLHQSTDRRHYPKLLARGYSATPLAVNEREKTAPRFCRRWCAGSGGSRRCAVAAGYCFVVVPVTLRRVVGREHDDARGAVQRLLGRGGVVQVTRLAGRRRLLDERYAQPWGKEWG